MMFFLLMPCFFSQAAIEPPPSAESILSQSQGETFGPNISSTALPVYAGLVMKTVIMGLGAALTAFIVYAGYLYMMAAGNKENVGKAKGYMTNAIIGLIICFSAYALTDYALFLIGRATEPTATQPQSAPTSWWDNFLGEARTPGMWQQP